MGKSVENPKKFIISCRVDDREMKTLQAKASESGINISDLLRQSILQLQHDRRFPKAANG
ncbi:MAG: ribbon-helix-helix protein, CopG family [Desulfuromonadales bacterium]|jgi:NRPS condensation-like uncharacterized protein